MRDSIPVPFTEEDMGWVWETEKLVIFFGGTRSSKEALRHRFPNLQQRQVKQVHGKLVLRDRGQDLTGLEADGLITDRPGLALCSLSADCTPILIYDPRAGQIAALHAGWRGVAQRILVEALGQFQNHSALQIWIGPHIQQNSFEVKNDALSLLMAASTASRDSVVRANPRNDKTGADTFQVDLGQILLSQIGEFEIGLQQVQRLMLDTKTDPRLHSYRRDKAAAGRQTSFIALKAKD